MFEQEQLASLEMVQGKEEECEILHPETPQASLRISGEVLEKYVLKISALVSRSGLLR